MRRPLERAVAAELEVQPAADGERLGSRQLDYALILDVRRWQRAKTVCITATGSIGVSD